MVHIFCELFIDSLPPKRQEKIIQLLSAVHLIDCNVYLSGRWETDLCLPAVQLPLAQQKITRQLLPAVYLIECNQ